MSDERRPRSRFDRDESDRPPRSRFDRRSRSPSSREPDSRRTRSPIGRGASDSPSSAEQKKAKVTDAAAAAAAAAARINAQIQAKKGIQHVDVPPIRTAVSPPVVKSPATPGKAIASETYQQDGDYIKDIEINDLRNRYTLTKGAVQKRIKDDTGADVTTRGEYYPDKSMATAANPPLYLRVTSTTKEGLDAAVKQIEELMQQELPNLVDERRFRRREPENFERDEFGRRKWPEEKLPVDLEPISGFNLRAQVVGRGGDNVKFIQQETGCKVQIKGRGSGFMEPQSGRESDEPMYLHIAGPRPEGVQRAKELCDELLQKVRTDYQAFKERPRYPQGGDGYSNGRPGYGDRDRSQSYGYGSYGGQNDIKSPDAASTANTQPADLNSQWAAYYAQQNGGQDPYAQWGGYEAYVQWYQYYAGTQAVTQQSPPPGTAAAPPPPPPSEPAPGGGVPPPPPPSGSPPGTYNAVPPPPGM
ncbi:hypothetical protein BU26DRAFT_445011 [Trematosphaeria pertusa]|uniref:K Homology domain-containing protein n=1 Tax=Trematosphaeria pertusa TaxID=390896 RepID=A0A6A6J4B4_9PLEO|nr:uncharacterized protein BU26DRAFT_445011 [Trematosphaeria pertusa]KAF2256323.1 hypothetical protein BU26DRAFT_445011 [Trematosphaeria pertusa]